MSFFLLGKDSDERLFLLSEATFGSRPDALAELSRLTAEPGFSHWDAEVLVMELSQGTSVLLVRPAAAAPGEAPAQDVAADDAPAPMTEEPLAEEPVTEESAAEEPVAEEPVADEPVTEEPAVAEPVEEPEAAAEGEPAEEPAEVAAEPVAGSEVEDPALAAVLEELQIEDAETQGVSLVDALRRTAVQMETEGIVVPESVGPAPESEEPTAQALTEPTEPETADAAPAAWPWDTGATGSFKLDALEEPGPDEGSLVRTAGDDETMSFARPVILGAYGDSTDQPAEEAPIGAAAPAVPEAPAEEPPVMATPEAPEAVASPSSVSEPEVVASSPAADVSDFILDLDEIVAAAPAPEPAAYEAAPQADIGQMTCNDCVYVETCPNRDQREPATCGSFQWK